ncbi:uncharacterized protein LOC128856511 [Anastrepha ludens]|uniref:uncharacterized protein LOC128856511 n=1 Tax=Anastrepha ludens TaxID=28586 RepID=UPI0023B1DD44|nr:uncharacterized protein LOC128856511 [Anastrepha ludens]
MICCGQNREVVKKGFKPCFNKKAITEKFYARHDQLIENPNYRGSYELYSEEIQRRQSHDPHNNMLAPRTENQVYGWLQFLAFKYEAGYDKFLFHRSRPTDENMKIQFAVNLATLRGMKR